MDALAARCQGITFIELNGVPDDEVGEPFMSRLLAQLPRFRRL